MCTFFFFFIFCTFAMPPRLGRWIFHVYLFFLFRSEIIERDIWCIKQQKKSILFFLFYLSLLFFHLLNIQNSIHIYINILIREKDLFLVLFNNEYVFVTLEWHLNKSVQLLIVFVRSYLYMDFQRLHRIFFTWRNLIKIKQ